MTISFDIDSTLIPYADEFAVESATLLARFLKAERIRKGTIKLFRSLEFDGHRILIYTTSYRTSLDLRKTFIAYGLKPSKFISGNLNDTTLKLNSCSASKNPKLFGIDLHIDDSDGVAMEGQKYGFKTVIVKPEETHWDRKIITCVNELQSNK